MNTLENSTLAILEKLVTDYQEIESIILDLDKSDNLPTEGEQVLMQWAGINAKSFLEFLSPQYIRILLSQSATSNTDKMQNWTVNYEVLLSPRQKGAGLDIRYSFQPSPFGEMLIASNDKQICELSFVTHQPYTAIAQLEKNWPQAHITEDKTRPFAEEIFKLVKNQKTELTLLLTGTAFQIKVWQTLLNIPFGSVLSYGDIAQAIGQPNSARAVGNAVGQNPIGYIVPCHRVIRKQGLFGYYQSGPARKKAILAWEFANAGC